MASRSTFRPVEETPLLSELNITPLIDVLLVLIVMLILTIPVMTHQLPLDLPGVRGPQTTQQISHRLRLDARGALSWDGRPIAVSALPARLAAMRAENDAELQIEPDAAAPYDRVDHTLATIKGAGITRLGFVGNERFADFSGSPR